MANAARCYDRVDIVKWVIRSLYFTPYVLASVAIELLARIALFSRYLCMSWKGVVSPTVTLERRSDGKRVVLIGVYHVADRSFYDGRQELIDEREREGAAVLFEGINSKELDLDELPRGKVRGLGMRLKSIGSKQRRRAREMNLTAQYNGLAYRDSWTRTDIDCREIIRLAVENDVVTSLSDELGLPSMDVVESRGAKFGLPSTDSPVDDEPPPDCCEFEDVLEAGIGLRLTALCNLYYAVRETFSRSYRTAMWIILDVRNAAAVDGIMKALNDSAEAVSIWGAAHLRGMVKLLKAEGFRVKRTDWPVAIGFRQNGLLAIADRARERAA